MFFDYNACQLPSVRNSLPIKTCACVWVVVMVKWSAWLPYTPTIRVRILLKPTVFSVKFVLEKSKNKLKDAEVGQFFTRGRVTLLIEDPE